MIEFSNVDFSYNGSEDFALRGLSFHIGKGELAVLSAPTGAGKSSVLKLLTCEERPDSGRVEVGGFDLSHLGRSRIAAYRRTIGCVFQDFKLLEEKTVLENVAFALEVQGKVSRARIRTAAAETLERMGIASRKDQFPRSLSLGERQRTAIARALVSEPLLLLADNPTSQLDGETSADILRIFANEHLRGMTIFLATAERPPLAGLPESTRYLRLENGVVS